MTVFIARRAPHEYSFLVCIIVAVSRCSLWFSMIQRATMTPHSSAAYWVFMVHGPFILLH